LINLSLYLVLDVRNDRGITLGDTISLLGLAAILDHKELVRGHLFGSQVFGGSLPRFSADFQGVEDLAQIEVVEAYLIGPRHRGMISGALSTRRYYFVSLFVLEFL